MDKEQIMEIIPHRDPFLLIDTIEELEPGIRVVATKYMDPDSFWFKGHFPGYPVTPGGFNGGNAGPGRCSMRLVHARK